MHDAELVPKDNNFLFMFWDTNLKLGYIHLEGSATHRLRVSPQSGHSDLLYSQKWVKVIFLTYGLKNYIGPSESTDTHSKCLELYCFSSWLGNIWPLGGHKHFERGSQQSLPPLKGFLNFYSTCFEIWIWNVVYTSGRWHDISNLSFIAIRSLPLETHVTLIFDLWNGKCY